MKPAPTRRLLATSSVLAAGLLAALWIAQTVLAQGQEHAGKGTVFTGETTVVAVEVPVQVVVGNEPVRGLQAKDFRVYDGKTARPLSGFEVVDVGRSSTEPGQRAAAEVPAFQAPGFAETPPAGRRHFLLVFDLSFSQAGYIARAVDSARELVRSGLQPSDLVAVAIYTDREGITLPLGFTPDRAQVDRVLDLFDAMLEGKRPSHGAVVAARKADPLGLTAGGWGADLAEVGNAAGYQTSGFAEAFAIVTGAGQYSGFQSLGSRNVGAFLERNILAHSAELSEQTIRSQRADQVIDLADVLKELAVQLRAVEGSKHLVLFSEGFDETLFDSFVHPNAGIDSGTNGLLEPRVRAMITELRRSGWVIQGVDLGGVTVGSARSGANGFKNGLAMLAHETGGTMVENTNDLAVGLQDVLERSSVTYVLTFQAEGVPLDGSFRPLRVEVAGLPRGAHVVYRTGYFAPSPPGSKKPLAERIEVAARLLGGGEPSGLTLAARATALDYDGALARVPVLAEVPARSLLSGGSGAAGSGPIEIQIYAYAFAEDGRVADFFAQSVKLAASELGGEPAAAGAKLAGELELPPGTYEIRVLVREPASDREGMRRFTLDVPPMAPGPRLLPPLFVQPVGERWVMASVVPGAGTMAAETYPFIVEGKRIAPAAVPVLARGQAARLLVPGIGLAQAGVELETRIVDEQGRAMKAGSLQILGRRGPVPGQPDLLVARLDADGLAPGSYRLEILLPPDAQGVREVAYAPFRVKG